MAITRTPMIDDDGSGTTGTIINNAWKQELYNQIDGIGHWVAQPFNAADYFGTAPMIWTVTAGQVKTHRYCQIGKTLHWAVYIENSTLSGTMGKGVNIKFPGGLLARGPNCVALANVQSDLPYAGIFGYWPDNADAMLVYYPAGNYTAGTFWVRFVVTLEVV